MSTYLFELAVIHTFLIAGYILLLRKEQQYGKMRFYLVGSSLAALIMPLIELPNPFYQAVELLPLPTDALATSPKSIEASPVVASTTWDPTTMVLIVYGTVSLFILFQFLRTLIRIIRLERRSKYEKYQDFYIRRTGDVKGSFSFLYWIFLNHSIKEREEEYTAILQHEQAHVHLGHTYDLLYLELWKICCWWLPSVWYTQKEIKKIHEYQADEHALKHCNIDQYSSILISSTLKASGLSLASSFHDGLILKRLEAMKKEQKSVGLWKLGSLSVLVTTLFVVFACNENPVVTQNEKEEVFTFVEETAQYPGGMAALHQHIAGAASYPDKAISEGIEGQTWVQFVIERDGSLSDIQTVKGIGGGCDEEVEKALKSASPFQPARQRGRTVRVKMVMPVIFQLQKRNISEGSPEGLVSMGEMRGIHSDLKLDAVYTDGEWTGTVYDKETGSQLPGANIIVEGTSLGTVSDLDGTFSIKAEAAQKLVVSFVGYASVNLAP